jgi:hypothetical protein
MFLPLEGSFPEKIFEKFLPPLLCSSSKFFDHKNASPEENEGDEHLEGFNNSALFEALIHSCMIIFVMFL